MNLSHKLYKAHFKGSEMNQDVTLDIYAHNMKEAWALARTYTTGMMLDDVYPTDDNWS